MMTDRVHELLYKPRVIDKRIGMLTAKIIARQSRLAAHGIRYDGVKVQTSPDDQMSRVMSEIVDLKAQLSELIQEREQAEREIEKYVSMLSDDTEKTILFMQYVAGSKIKFADIADTLGYSYRQTNRIREKALMHLDKKMS